MRMSPPSSPLLLLRTTGAGLWAMVGIGQMALLVGAPSRLAEPPLLVWLISFLSFGVASWLNVDGQRGSSCLLGVQGLGVLGVLATSHAAFEGVLLSLIGVRLPFCLPPRRAALWVVGLSLSSSLVFLAVFSPWPAWTRVVNSTSLLVFSFNAALLQQREADGRRELARVNKELEAAQALLAEREREQERLRIARDLHDSLGHHLTALSLNLEVASHTTQGPGIEHVQRARKVSRTLLGEVRQVVSSLREGHTHLAPALRSLVRDVPGLVIHLEVPEDLSLSRPEAAHSVFSCVQEVITNTLRHASASHLWIEVTAAEAGGVQVHARDDGRGAFTLKPGAGLSGMRERFTRLGGRVELHPVEGQGMELVAWLPDSAVLG
ncbi:two-component sensor histidine kinase [Cystobacter ferrugineus]|uniref:Two-component sensor histidine kinase n=2 Tax=Cystobacter ferrugineus TaxID=83449 RepID=A0A1L9B9X1_9BACT|nr:two-component sensor histidine kinase [Cystobacter ferrugineus]